MNIPRKILKIILSSLSKWAIHKHKMEVIVVAGFSGSEVVKEGIYHILKEKFIVRRNTEPVTWDMSIPLSVLGYKDKKRNFFEWLGLIVRVNLVLLFGRINPHILVLSANCKFSDTAKFWSSFLSPDYFVVLSSPQKSEIVKKIFQNLSSEKSIVIYDNAQVSLEDIKQYKFKKALAFGKAGTKADLSFDLAKRVLIYKGEKLKIPSITPLFTYSFIAGIFLTVINHQLTFKEAGFEALKFDLGLFLTKRIKTNIEQSN
ncbi:hypothetical protein JW978_03905 [Candidatus Dojkabacteria bacterium]|nr:hypothetical protein [Candidatus Dojkabacteria bacterium]